MVEPRPEPQQPSGGTTQDLMSLFSPPAPSSPALSLQRQTSNERLKEENRQLRLRVSIAEGVPPSPSQQVPRASSADELATSHMPAHWAPMGGGTCAQIPIAPEDDPELWARVETRVAESLHDYRVVSITRVQNKALWRKYSRFCAELAESNGAAHVNERELFHYCKPEVVAKITESDKVGFDPRIGGGEYGNGTYFAQHAVYSVAYGGGWLDKGIEAERAASSTITLLWAKVALGQVRDFGGRCRSSRGNAAAVALGMELGSDANAPGLLDWEGKEDGRSTGAAQSVAGFSKPPSGYDSVSGTEGELAWCPNPRLSEGPGARLSKGAIADPCLGRQFVTFETWQAYPELLLQLERTQACTQQFERAQAQEELGRADKPMELGCELWVKGYGTGTLRGFKKQRVGANIYVLDFGGEARQLKLRDQEWHVVDGPGAPGLEAKMNGGRALTVFQLDKAAVAASPGVKAAGFGFGVDRAGVIAHVDPRSPAARAALPVGGRIASVNGASVVGKQQIVERIGSASVVELGVEPSTGMAATAAGILEPVGDGARETGGESIDLDMIARLSLTAPPSSPAAPGTASHGGSSPFSSATTSSASSASSLAASTPTVQTSLFHDDPPPKLLATPGSPLIFKSSFLSPEPEPESAATPPPLQLLSGSMALPAAEWGAERQSGDGGVGELAGGVATATATATATTATATAMATMTTTTTTTVSDGRLKALFDFHDDDGDGYLGAQELHLGGRRPGAFEFTKICLQLDADAMVGLEFDDFRRAYTELQLANAAQDCADVGV